VTWFSYYSWQLEGRLWKQFWSCPWVNRTLVIWILLLQVPAAALLWSPATSSTSPPCSTELLTRGQVPARLRGHAQAAPRQQHGLPLPRTRRSSTMTEAQGWVHHDCPDPGHGPGKAEAPQQHRGGEDHQSVRPAGRGQRRGWPSCSCTWRWCISTHQFRSGLGAGGDVYEQVETRSASLRF